MSEKCKQRFYLDPESGFVVDETDKEWLTTADEVYTAMQGELAQKDASVKDMREQGERLALLLHDAYVKEKTTEAKLAELKVHLSKWREFLLWVITFVPFDSRPTIAHSMKNRGLTLAEPEKANE